MTGDSKLIKFLKIHWAIFILNFAIIIFFSRLFFPQLSTFSTPDFGQSDVLHGGLAQKIAQHESMKDFQLPQWEDTLGMGYPAIPEFLSFFFIPNFILSFFPTQYSMPIFFMSLFLIAANSMYFLLIYLKHPNTAAATGSAAFAFSAAMILKITHTSVIPAVSIFPLLFYFIFKFVETKQLKQLILLSLVASQILITFPQLFAYSVILLALFFFLYSKLVKKIHLTNIIKSLFLLNLIAIVVSAIVLLPFLEMTQKSSRLSVINPQLVLTSFTYNLNNTLSFVNPYINGNAQIGTYNTTDWSKDGIFWENTGYVGILPLLLSLFAIFYAFKKRQKNIYLPIAILVIITVLLSLGKNSPLNIIFSFPPISLFRVPSRFLLFTQFFMAILASYSLAVFQKKSPLFSQKLLPLVFFLTVGELAFVWWDYHSIDTYQNITKAPEIFQNIDLNSQKQYRFLTLGSEVYWNSIFNKKGWKDQDDYFLFFLNSAKPNLSTAFGINQLESYQILTTRRQGLLQSLIFQNIEQNQKVKINTRAKNALIFSAVKFLITTKEIDDQSFKKVSEISKDNYKFFIYEFQSAKPIINLYYNTKNIKIIEDFSKVLDDDLKGIVLLENFDKDVNQVGEGQIYQVKKTNTTLRAKVKTSKPAVFVFADSYYPGWEAKLDGKNTKIFAANINSKAVYIPEGEHTVEFNYASNILKFGTAITLISLTLISLLFLKKHKVMYAKVF